MFKYKKSYRLGISVKYISYNIKFPGLILRIRFAFSKYLKYNDFPLIIQEFEIENKKGFYYPNVV